MKRSIEDIKASYLNQGVSEACIDFAIAETKRGEKRAFILESLTASYMGMNYLTAEALLNDLYETFGSEFKKENRQGFLIGIPLLIIGGCGIFFKYFFKSDSEINFSSGNELKLTIAIWLCIIIGILFLTSALLGIHRDSPEDFNNNDFSH